jgi:TDG/mug DNA glycosylase family protein
MELSKLFSMESDNEKRDSPRRQKSELLTFGSLDLTQFAYSQKPSTPLRRSPRKSSSLRFKDTSPTRSNAEDEKLPTKRALEVKSETGSPQRSPKKVKRTYATPETYAHLSGLQDWLKEELDGTVYASLRGQSTY